MVIHHSPSGMNHQVHNYIILHSCIGHTNPASQRYTPPAQWKIHNKSVCSPTKWCPQRIAWLTAPITRSALAGHFSPLILVQQIGIHIYLPANNEYCFCVHKIGNDQSPAWSWLETKLTNQESPSCSEVITIEGDVGNPFARKDVPRDAARD